MMKPYQMMGWAVVILSGVAFSTDAWGQSGRSRGDFGGGKGSWHGGHHRRGDRNNGSGIVIYTGGSGDDSGLIGGFPPGYRLNYYTPWMSDYEDGTAWQKMANARARVDGYNNQMGYSNMPSGNAEITPPPDAAQVDFVVAVQRELRRRGFYNGVVNGVSDASTRAAIRAYEASAGLPVTGIIGLPLLRTLSFL